MHGVLARAPAGWLLVFDNVTDRASVEPFVPPAGPGRVLITTQNQHWPPGQALEVPVLDAEVAAEFLVNRTGDPDRAAARELAGVLGGLPLALEQAAAYMQATGTTLAGYLPLFRDRQADLLARGEAAGHPGRGGHAGAGPVPAGRRRPGCGGAAAAAGVPGARAGPAGPAAAGDAAAASSARRWRPRWGRCWGMRWRRGMRSRRCAGIRWSPRPGTGWCWCTGWCRPSPAPSCPPMAAEWRQAAAALVEAAIPADPELPAAGRRARCCCRTPGLSST